VYIFFFYIVFNLTFHKCLLLIGIDYNELVETTVIEDKCSKIDNIRSKSEKGIKIFIYIFIQWQSVIGYNDTTSTHVEYRQII